MLNNAWKNAGNCIYKPAMSKKKKKKEKNLTSNPSANTCFSKEGTA